MTQNRVIPDYFSKTAQKDDQVKNSDVSVIIEINLFLYSVIPGSPAV